jgi:hypothetical protein
MVLRALTCIAVAAIASAGCGTSRFADQNADLHFNSAAGWNTASAVGPGCPSGGAVASTGAIHDAPSDFPGETIERLAPAATLVWACGIDAGRWSKVNFEPATLPLRLADARMDQNWEGQPNFAVPQYLLWRRVGRYDLDVRVFFGSQHPSADRLADAQAELERLRLPIP